MKKKLILVALFLAAVIGSAFAGGRSDNNAQPTGAVSGVTVVLKGNGAERKINLSANGVLFVVNTGITLTLDNNITLRGMTSNTESLVHVYSGGTLIMKNGSKISGNTAMFGGGVYVGDAATFTKIGGTIYGSNASGTLKNTAANDYHGHAVLIGTSPTKKRNTNAEKGSGRLPCK